MVSSSPMNYLQARQESLNHLAEHRDLKEPVILLQRQFCLSLPFLRVPWA